MSKGKNSDKIDRDTLSRAISLYGNLLKVTAEQRQSNEKQPEQVEKIRETQMEIINKVFHFINDAEFDVREERRKLIALKIKFLEADRDYYGKLEKKNRKTVIFDSDKRQQQMNEHEKYVHILTSVLEELQETEEYLRDL